jgi:hypothetical protein
MKHLRKFNEAVELDEYELESFTENNLAFIIDDGFIFNIRTSRVYGPTKCSVTIHNGHDKKGYHIPFKFEKIKYDIIQFIELLDTTFLIEKDRRLGTSINVFNTNTDSFDNKFYVKEYTIQEFLDEDTEFSEVVSSIEFVVIGKK